GGVVACHSFLHGCQRRDHAAGFHGSTDTGGTRRHRAGAGGVWLTIQRNFKRFAGGVGGVTEKLAGSWSVAPLSELAEINPGIDKARFQDSDEVPFVPMPAVEAGTGRMDVSGRRPFAEVKSGFTPFASGDVLFAKITPC